MSKYLRGAFLGYESQNRIYEAGVGVKRKKKKLCLCRQASMIAGDKLGDTDCLVTI
jgi:hypothetical protein